MVFAIAPAAHRAAAQNLVANPGFEQTENTGGGTATSTADWTVSAGFGTEFIDTSGGVGEGEAGSHGGDWYASFAATSANDATSGTLSQMITTVPGTTYLVSFYLANAGQPHDTFLASFGGQTVLSLTDAPAFDYTLYSMTVTAKSAQTLLAFTGEQDPAEFGLDDISVEAQSAPAPVTGGGLASIGLVAAGFAVRRMRRAGHSAA
jgi:hypothetical protein